VLPTQVTHLGAFHAMFQVCCLTLHACWTGYLYMKYLMIVSSPHFSPFYSSLPSPLSFHLHPTTFTQLKVDMEKEAILLPINGRSVPFHISTIKNISMPEQDRATWMRINFFIPGVALGKDVAKNIQQLVRNAPSLCIILPALFL
jgi:hypothetical protein